MALGTEARGPPGKGTGLRMERLGISSCEDYYGNNGLGRGKVIDVFKYVKD